MKIVCQRESLSNAFQICASVVPARSPKPILRHIKLDAGDNGAWITGTDLEVGIRCQIKDAEIKTAGQTVVPASEAVAILRELPSESVTLETHSGGVRIEAVGSRFDLPGEDPLQFPELPGFPAVDGYKIRSETLAGMTRRVIFAAASENSRYALNSVLMEFKEGKAMMVATDGRRLATMPGAVLKEGQAPPGLSLLPQKSLTLLQKVLGDPEEEVEVLLQANEALFRTPRMTLYSRLVEGKFPRYQDVFPPKPKIIIPLVVGRFLSVLRQAKIVTSLESKGVIFKFEPGELRLESRSPDLGQADIRLPIGYDGPSIQVTFDAEYFIQPLRVLEPEQEVTLELVDHKQASVMRTTDGYAYVVMPLTKERE